MRYLNRKALGALTLVGLAIGGPASAQQRPVGVPSVAPPGADATPPPDMPRGAGPGATSGSKATARFDEVGYATIGKAMAGDSVALAALHPGDYAEITSLDTGRIILAAVVPGTPAAGRLALLSADAATALGVVPGKPIAVRIREVQPQAGDEAALKRGQRASRRLDAPASLLTGLRARLPQVAPLPAARPPHQATPPAATPPAAPSPKPTAGKTPPPPAKPGPASPKPAPAPQKAAAGRYHVQVATFASQANARKLAARLKGGVIPAGKYWRVELGPFATSSAAQRARDDVARRGYGDARVRKD